MACDRNVILTLSTGMFCGFFSFYLLNSTLTMHPHHFEGYSLLRKAYSRKSTEDGGVQTIKPQQIHSSYEMYREGENQEAEKLYQQVRVLCWIMTNPNNHNTKARHVKLTWAKRCNKVLFISTAEDEFLEPVVFNIPEGRDYLWSKTKEAFKYIYRHHFNDADWFMKADDDTYVIVENLRYMLSAYNASDPLYFGCKFKDFTKQGYMSGGAGYILSKESLNKFVEEAIPNPRKCRSDGSGPEDVEIGKCLENVGVLALDTRDYLGRGRFFPFVPEFHLIPGYIATDNWYWNLIYYPACVGMECCSDTAISFHYVPPNKMYELEYFIYQLRPYGVLPKSPFPPPLPPDKTGIPQHVLDRYNPKDKLGEVNSSLPSVEDKQMSGLLKQ